MIAIRRNIYRVSQIALALTLLPALAHASGHEGGNAGRVQVCRESTGAGAIQSVQLLDLWEAKNLKFARDDRPFDQKIVLDLVQTKIDRLSFAPEAKALVQARLSMILSQIEMTSRKLELTDDGETYFKPDRGCAWEQVATYGVDTETGNEKVFIDQEIYLSPRMSNLDRAGLILHEAIYDLDREYSQAKTSQKTRRMVAHLMANDALDEMQRAFLKTRLDAPEILYVDSKALRSSTDAPLQIAMSRTPVYGFTMQVEFASGETLQVNSLELKTHSQPDYRGELFTLYEMPVSVTKLSGAHIRLIAIDLGCQSQDDPVTSFSLYQMPDFVGWTTAAKITDASTCQAGTDDARLAPALNRAVSDIYFY